MSSWTLINVLGLHRGRCRRVGDGFDARESELGTAFAASTQQARKPVRGKGVVGLEDIDVVALGFLEAPIDRVGRAHLTAVLNEHDAQKSRAHLFPFEVAADHAGDARVRGILHDDDFDRLVVLLIHRSQRGFCVPFLLPRRHDHTDER